MMSYYFKLSNSFIICANPYSKPKPQTPKGLALVVHFKMQKIE